MVSEALRPRLLEALGRVLEPVVLPLLKSGISWKEFSDLAKEKFVTVATEAFGIRGRPTNVSRVAILTGLDRRDVAKLRAPRERRATVQGFMSKPTQLLPRKVRLCDGLEQRRDVHHRCRARYQPLR